MTNELRELARPLLTDPPHPAPPLDELRARVHRRRQRRARTIGALSVLVVVVIAGAVLALPRSSELRVGDGSEAPSSTTTAPPPPFVAGPVELAFSPQSAPFDAIRVVEIRNHGTEPYSSCLFYNLFRWTGEEWEPVAVLHAGQNPAVLRPYDPQPPSVDCGTDLMPAGGLPPGASAPLGLDLSRATWQPDNSGSPPPTEPFADGWYELREVVPAEAEPAPGLGRFEIATAGDGAATEPPPLAASDVQLIVIPESAPLTADRSLRITNTSDQPYTECGGRFELRRWDGNGWVAIGIFHTMTQPPFLQESAAPFIDGRCVGPYTVEPGGDVVTPFNPGTTVRSDGGGTIPATREPLEPGRYELAAVGSSTSPLTALGRFDITP
jgi:hypothetical protein